ncbi:MAG: rhodanese-like domain-containing protein [Candidatus Poribacteria bacterium]|jgi:adenylyltransferase/sulfurtransferase|nr:rhodanese-like domain-containing protein [Candidatus Poribacteria bacterium]
MQTTPSLPEILPRELKQKLDANEPVFLLDVREPSEYDIVHLEGAQLVPLNTLPHNVESLPSDQEIVVYCHHGTRSLYATAYLHQNGFRDAKNLAGGIDQWAAEIDPTLQRY